MRGHWAHEHAGTRRGGPHAGHGLRARHPDPRLSLLRGSGHGRRSCARPPGMSTDIAPRGLDIKRASRGPSTTSSPPTISRTTCTASATRAARAPLARRTRSSPRGTAPRPPRSPASLKRRARPCSPPSPGARPLRQLGRRKVRTAGRVRCLGHRPLASASARAAQNPVGGGRLDLIKITTEAMRAPRWRTGELPPFILPSSRGFELGLKTSASMLFRSARITARGRISISRS